MWKKFSLHALGKHWTIAQMILQTIQSLKNLLKIKRFQGFMVWYQEATTKSICKQVHVVFQRLVMLSVQLATMLVGLTAFFHAKCLVVAEILITLLTFEALQNVTDCSVLSNPIVSLFILIWKRRSTRESDSEIHLPLCFGFASHSKVCYLINGVDRLGNTI